MKEFAALLAIVFTLTGRPAQAQEWSEGSADSLRVDSTDAAAEEAPVASDPLQLYLKTLADSSNSRLEDPALEALSISDAEVDSLLRAYQATGKTARSRANSRWRFSFGVGDARYNRVEGLNIGPEMTVRPPSPRPTDVRAWAGYGWSSKDVTGGAEARVEVTPHAGRPLVHASWSREVHPFGSGLVVGNSVTSLVFGNDYGDYFRIEGWNAGVAFTPGNFQVDAMFRAEQQESLENAAGFAVFEGDEGFRQNPAIDDGDLRALHLLARWSERPEAPWTVRFDGDFAGRGLGGDFDYERAWTEVVGRRRVWLGDRVIGSVSGGAVSNGAPFQALHLLGGFKTLRGYDINEFLSRSYMHARMDYEVGSNPFRWLPWIRKLRLQPVAFFDAASIFNEETRAGTTIPHADPDWKFSGGMGVQMNLLGIPGGSGQIRFDIARRLDRSEENMTYRGSITLAR